jgi:two-component system LytT family response regulator
MTVPLRILVLDDESIARKRLVRLLGDVAGIERIIECERPEEARERIAEEELDVCFFDIQMPGQTGIELARSLPEDRPYIVFLTAHPEHALDAFDVGAVDYILKPVDTPRLEKALDRAKKYLDGPPRPGKDSGADGAADTTTQKLALSTQQGVVLIAPRDITHADFDGALVTVHTKEKKVLTDASLQDLEAKLPAGLFERVHRRALLNLDRVSRLEPVASGGYIAHMDSGDKVDISRQSARKLRRRLGIL